jgi:competence protein ComEC
MNFLTKIFDKKHPESAQNFPLWIPVFFGFGIAFYFKFLVTFPALIGVTILLFIISRSFILLACVTFLLGGFYAKFYEQPDQLKRKIFVEVTGKVEAIKKFTNPINHSEGATLLVSELSLAKVESIKKEQKPKKKRKISAKKIEKDFVNLKGYQEIDREFLDYKNAYQNDIPQNLKRISVNLVKDSDAIEVNDKITFRALLQPPTTSDFPSDFDYALNAKINKIAAYGFVSGEVKVLQKQKISDLESWFSSLREKIRKKISTTLDGDEAAISKAFLIGDQKEISKDLSKKIRDSGLSHLLSISGFHLSLAGAIFFFATRFLLSRREDFTLKFDLKKIASLVAIFAVYFYLKIAGSPLPAQRAFLFVLFALITLFVGEKLDAKRATMFGALLIILMNPYVIFSVSFQLSFAAILVLISFSKTNRNYFLQIILLSILIQIATLPFLMHHFQNVAVLGFVANLLAIPLTSFVIMPAGFLALFLMILGLEKIPLLVMDQGILVLKKIVFFVTSISYSHLLSPWLPGFGLALAIVGLLMICLSKNQIRLVGALVFVTSFLTICCVKKPDVIFEKNQKFFAVYDENGLKFSKNLRDSKQRQHWMNKFDESEFKTFFCEKDFCEVEIKNKKILALLKRNKISEICKKDFDFIVNLTAKYQLPDCIDKSKTKIDNKDFYLKGTQFLFFKNEKFDTQKIQRGRKTKRDNEGDFGNDAVEIDSDFED